MEWSIERIETLKRMWAEGATARDIAQRIGGITRNAVIGKAYRLGLSGQAAPAKPPPEPPMPPLAGILDLTERMCRWPTGHPDQKGFGFCGRLIVTGQPYCHAHCVRAYAPRKESAA